MARYNFPFTAIIGQPEMQLALLLNLVDPKIGGVYACGTRGSGKSTAVRALTDILPTMDVFENDPYNTEPSQAWQTDPQTLPSYVRKSKNIRLIRQTKIPLVDLPLGATEDRLCGTIDIQKALVKEKKSLNQAY